MQELSVRISCLAFGYVAHNGNGGAAYLACQSIQLMRRKGFSQPIHFRDQRKSLLPSNQVAITLRFHSFTKNEKLKTQNSGGGCRRLMFRHELLLVFSDHLAQVRFQGIIENLLL